MRLWTAIRDMFNPWICPLSGSEMADCDKWIQQLAEGQKVLQPWAPGSGDAKHAAAVFDRFVIALAFLEETVPAPRFELFPRTLLNNKFTPSIYRTNRDILGHAWSYYAGYFANTATKDYVLAVSQSSLINLRWCNFVPDASDVDQMVRIIDTFLPLCHGFLGKVFVQIPWLDIVEEQRHSEILVQAILRLIVKLAAEPQVRQVSGSNMDAIKSPFSSLQLSFIMHVNEYSHMTT